MTRRPFEGRFSITGDRDTHAEYGVGPATDYGLPEGTPVLAPWAGTVSTYTTGSGGTTIELDGEAVLVAQHLSVALVSGPVREGQVIARSGRSGTPPPATGLTTYDPHLHAYVRVAGVRLAVEEYFAARGFAAGALGDVVPGTLLTAAGLPTKFPEEDTMAQMYFRHADTGAIGVFGGPAPVVFASIEEYHAWRGLLLAWNAKNPAHEALVPPGEAIADQLVNVDDVGWGVLMRVHSASVDSASAPAPQSVPDAQLEQLADRVLAKIEPVTRINSASVSLTSAQATTIAKQIASALDLAAVIKGVLGAIDVELDPADLVATIRSAVEDAIEAKQITRYVVTAEAA